MNHRIKTYLKKLPFRIVRDIPKPKFELIQLALAYQAFAKPDATFVQVGACDGRTEDAVNRFVRSGVFRSVLIEPIPSNYRQLEREYEGVPNLSLLNAAVATTTGSGIIYQVKDAGRWKDNPYSKQWASFDRRHLLKLGATESEIEGIRIETVTLSEVVDRFGLDRIDMLQIDTEGFDAEVVRMALNLSEVPDFIYFEFIHVKKDLNRLMKSIQSKGYIYSYDRYNVLAIHERVISGWSSNRRPISDSIASRQS